MPNTKKKIYFASDFHLGAPRYQESLQREKKIVDWLSFIEPTALEIFLVGDLFDFWFEYKHAIPKGFVRLQGKIASLCDSGIPVHVFTGNHDMWIFDYLPKELGISLHRKPIEREFNEKKFLIGHGDGLGPGDRGYKFLKKVFENRFCQWSFARIHPNLGFWMANYFSKTSRIKNGHQDELFHGKENEWLFQFCQDYLQEKEINYFVFGHRHLPLAIPLSEKASYFNLGDWLKYDTYLEFDGEVAQLKQWKNNMGVPFNSLIKSENNEE